jgi:hypothetical protein
MSKRAIEWVSKRVIEWVSEYLASSANFGVESHALRSGVYGAVSVEAIQDIALVLFFGLQPPPNRKAAVGQILLGKMAVLERIVATKCSNPPNLARLFGGRNAPAKGGEVDRQWQGPVQICASIVLGDG